MESSLDGAKTRATNATALPEYERRARYIRMQLWNKKDFHLREMEKDLGWGALKYAKEGNEWAMESSLDGAKTRAVSAA